MSQRRSDREAAADAYNAANRLLERADYAGAVRKYGIALELDAGLAVAYYNRALAHSRMGDEAAAAADFQTAAVAGLDEDYFYDAWVRHQVFLRGFASVLRLCESWDIPTHQRHRLEEKLNFHLRQRHFLLNEVPEAGMEFAAESLALRCYMADLLRNVSPDVEVIDRILGLLAENVGDAQAEWRARYLVAAVYGSEILLPMETIEGSIGLFWDDAQVSTMFVASEGARSALDAVLGNYDERWAALSRETRFARFALSQLEIATKTLVANRQFRIGLASELFTQWEIVEDIFRASVELSLHLCDGRAYQSTVGQARHFSAIVEASRWVTSTDGAEWNLAVVKRRLDRLLGATDLESLPSLPPRTLVIDYFIYEKASDTIACHVAGQSGSGFDTRPISPDMVIELLGISQQWDRPDTTALDARREEATPGKLRRTLARILLAEHDVPSDAYPASVDEGILGCLRDRLGDVERLVIVPWGYLQTIPIHLLDSARAALDSGRLREIVYAPSTTSVATAYGLQDRRSARFLFIAVGADLPLLGAEIDLIRSLFPSATLLVDREATRERVLEELPQSQVVHFACHGGFDREANTAFLELYGDRLYPVDVLSSHGPMPMLVFLNACVTGVTSRRGRNSEATIGLPQALLAAGTVDAVAALWEIDDEAALEVAGRFFRRWRADETATAARVLVEVQAEMRRSPKFNDMFLWGAHAVWTHAR